MQDYKPCPTCKMMVRGDCQFCNPKKPVEFRSKDEIMRTESCKIAAIMLSRASGFTNTKELITVAKEIEQYIREGK